MAKYDNDSSSVSSGIGALGAGVYAGADKSTFSALTLDAKNFKTYEELKAHLQKVLAGSSSKVKAENVDLSAPAYQPAPSAPSAPMPDETEDESLSYFANLANDE